MKFFCTKEFKREYDRLIKSNRYKALGNEFYQYFFDKNEETLRAGRLLNNDFERPYVKLRLYGSDGLRVYYYMIKVKGCLYFMYIHSKTGSDGIDNISNEKKKELYKDILSAIQENNLYEIRFENNTTLFV